MRTLTIMMFVVCGFVALGVLSQAAWLFCQWKLKELMKNPKSSNNYVRKWLKVNKFFRAMRIPFVFVPVTLFLLVLLFISAIVEGIKEGYSDLIEGLSSIPSLFADECRSIFHKNSLANNPTDERINQTRERYANGEDV